MLKLKYIDTSISTNLGVEKIGNAYFSARADEYSQLENKTKVECEYILLKQLLNSINIDLDKIKIVKTKSGKPVFENLNLFFSISHSKNIVVVAVSNKPIGIDIQAMAKADLKVAQRYFSNAAFTKITHTKNADWQFTKQWAKYESTLKLFGSRKAMLEQTSKTHTKTKILKDSINTRYYLCITTQT